MKKAALLLATFLSVPVLTLTAQAQEFKEPLPVEQIPAVATLPEQYPNTWIFMHDLNFNSLLDGKVVIYDVAAESNEFKGMVGAGMFASFLPSRTGKELYVGETFYSRRTYGERTDAIIIYDKSSLKPIDEIILPGGKRGQVVTVPGMLQFTDGERLALNFNFTPAASVTVIDLPNRKVLGEISTPGCSVVYPTGQRGFSSLCGNGTLATFILNADGTLASQSVSEAFNDIDNDPLFISPVVIDGINYFVSFKGEVQPIDLRKDKPSIGKKWSLLTKDEAAKNWRPGGWQVIATDEKLLYVLMHENGEDGTHKSGGSEVWVYDVKKKQRVRKITLKDWGISIEATVSNPGYLVVTSPEAETAGLRLDVYDAASGQHVRTLGGIGGSAPFLIQAVR